MDADAIAVIRGDEQAALVLHPLRRALLARLAEPESAAGLSRKLGVPRQRLNYHLRELEREKLIECVEERRKGNCTERILKATARAFVISPEALGAFGDTPEAAQDRFSASYLVAAAARAIRDVSVMEERARKAAKRVSTLTLESDVRFPTAAARAAFAKELTEVTAQLVARHHDERAAGGRRFRLVTVVHPAVAETETPPAPGGRRTATGTRHSKKS